VAKVFWQGCVSGQLPFHLGVTLLRLVASFSVAMLLGCAIGILLGRNKKLDAFFDNWLVIFLNIPALVTIILCYVWFGLVESAAILAVVINKLPNIIVTIRKAPAHWIRTYWTWLAAFISAGARPWFTSSGRNCIRL
jgi:NitT/TauT family transport system permease protein